MDHDHDNDTRSALDQFSRKLAQVDLRKCTDDQIRQVAALHIMSNDPAFLGRLRDRYRASEGGSAPFVSTEPAVMPCGCQQYPFKRGDGCSLHVVGEDGRAVVVKGSDVKGNP